MIVNFEGLDTFEIENKIKDLNKVLGENTYVELECKVKNNTILFWVNLYDEGLFVDKAKLELKTNVKYNDLSTKFNTISFLTEIYTMTLGSILTEKEHIIKNQEEIIDTQRQTIKELKKKINHYKKHPCD